MNLGLHATIEVDTAGQIWVCSGFSEVGPFPSLLSASEHIIWMITLRAQRMYGHNVYFLEGISKR